MRTRIISAFPGTGKTTFYEKYKDITLDSDSSNFSWVTQEGKKIRNPDFPQNYINHIKDNIGKYRFILVSSHKEVRDALIDNCLFFYLAYPALEHKNDYLKRYKERGSSEAFIQLLENNWDAWIYACSFYTSGCKQVLTHSYLEQTILGLLYSENDTI